ncbi:hypothetical protein AB0B42_00470 [Streptomyces fradiae]|uniref:hypothetical protein n=1 Tax=Streptomyces fradiae TaxID=1906 RepID=UPI0033D41B3F
MSRFSRRLAAARNVIAGQAARIRELERLLNREQDRARHTAAVLKGEVERLTAEVDELSAARPEQAALVDLRRRLYLAERARASLDAQILTLQAANEATARIEYDRRWAA